MDFTKFFSLVEKRKLYFPNAWQLLRQDPSEGSLTAFHKKLAGERVMEHREEWDLLNAVGTEKYQEMRKFTYINSWHMGEHESAAMWKIYDRSNHGLAVVSTFKRLCASLSYKRPIHIGAVKYIDRDTDDGTWLGNLFDPYMHKSNYFAYENEVRAVLTDDFHLIKPSPLLNPTLDESERFRPDPPLGISVECNLETLIQRVVVSPTAPDWVVDLVKNYCKKVVGKEASSSSMTTEPYF